MQGSRRCLWIIALWSNVCFAATTRDHAVEISAVVQESPAQITLMWSNNNDGLQLHLQRKLKSDKSWTSLATFSPSVTTFVDTNVSVGSAFEYALIKLTNNYPRTGYIYAGIRAPFLDQHGKLILLVDSTYTASLSNELALLTQDLIGDGWVVARHDVPRSLTPPDVKSIIENDYSSDSNGFQALFIVGHVAVPYSGDYNADSHAEHTGAWVADTYYADVDGTWTDILVNDTNATRTANWNIPGDGKFDQSNIPTSVHFQAGRIDFVNLPAFAPTNDVDLLRAYLRKDHNFRMGALTLQKRALLFDGFGESGGEAYAASGWRNMAPLLGAANVTALATNEFLPTVSAQDYLWTCGFGGGDKNYMDCYSFAQTSDFVHTQCKTAFMMFFGSYFGDWDATNCVFRAALGSGDILTVAWVGRPHWFFHHMGLGEEIGYSARLSQVNSGLYQPTNYCNEVHISLLGDPTLKMFVVLPPSSLTVATNGAYANLQWTASADVNLLGYHVYRADGTNAFVRLTASPVSDTTYRDLPPIGTHTYMVRALKLDSSFSGTFTNGSQGIFNSVTTQPIFGAVSVSQPVLNSGHLSFLCTGQPGQTFVVEDSADFLQWTAIATNTLVTNQLTFTDVRALTVGLQCYRTRLAQ